VTSHLDELEADKAQALMDTVKSEGKVTIKTCQGEFELTSEMIKGLKIKTKNVKEKTYLPGVIEPSFGVGRILYAIMEHSFSTRPQSDEDKKKGVQKGVMSFPPSVSPVKCAVFALSNRDESMKRKCVEISRELTKRSISNRLDMSSTTIGRRYVRGVRAWCSSIRSLTYHCVSLTRITARITNTHYYYYVTQVRSDELGLPFIVTIDFETIDKTKCKSENRFDTVTVRERDSAKQIRVKCDEVANLIFDLVMGRVQWSECLSKYANEN